MFRILPHGNLGSRAVENKPYPSPKVCHENNDFNETLSVITLINAFEKRISSLLRDFNVQQSGYTKLSTAEGLSLTADAVSQALESRKKAKKQKLKATEEKDETSENYKRPAADIRHLGALGPICKAQRVGLDVTRAAQRNI